ncbi:hypersensitive-induced response protein 4-like [Bidens hawaiensis]|uniref:hypersensitive-induced response protein 4-like n=1 Tax=Bidens hawaiensis TaxID=980011 RepID=UPI00404A13DE
MLDCWQLLDLSACQFLFLLAIIPNSWVNVFVQIISSIQYRVIKQSADDAFYELQNLAEQIQAYMAFVPVVFAQVPRMTLDQLFEQKDEVAKTVLEELKKVMGEYGYMIEHILIVDIIHDPSVLIAMNEINAENNNISSIKASLASVYRVRREVYLLQLVSVNTRAPIASIRTGTL